MYFAGWHGVDKVTFPEALEQLPGGRWVKRGEIKDYFDDVFYVAYKEWKYWKRFGLGNGQGWRNEREIHLKLIDIFESEMDIYTSHKTKQATKK